MAAQALTPGGYRIAAEARDLRRCAPSHHPAGLLGTCRKGRMEAFNVFFSHGAERFMGDLMLSGG
jgi:hypothetical protein